MLNIPKLEFNTLDVYGKNYLTWALDVKIPLNAMNLRNTTRSGTTW